MGVGGRRLGGGGVMGKMRAGEGGAYVPSETVGRDEAKREGGKAKRSKTLRHPGFPGDLSPGTDGAQW